MWLYVYVPIVSLKIKFFSTTSLRRIEFNVCYHMIWKWKDFGENRTKDDYYMIVQNALNCSLDWYFQCVFMCVCFTHGFTKMYLNIVHIFSYHNIRHWTISLDVRTICDKKLKFLDEYYLTFPRWISICTYILDQMWRTCHEYIWDLGSTNLQILDRKYCDIVELCISVLRVWEKKYKFRKKCYLYIYNVIAFRLVHFCSNSESLLSN